VMIVGGTTSDALQSMRSGTGIPGTSGHIILKEGLRGSRDLLKRGGIE